MPLYTKFFGYRFAIENNREEDEIQYRTLKDILDDPSDAPVPLQRAENFFTFDGQITKKNGLYLGAFSLIQTNNIPTKARLGEDPEDLFSDEDDDGLGLGHYTAFIYDPKYDIIMVQSNKNGVTANGMVAFFKRNFDIDNMEAEVLLSKEDLQKLDRLSIISSFEISLAKPTDAGDFGNAGNATFKRAVQFADEVEGNSLKIHVGMGYDRTASLKRGNLLNTVKSLLRISPGEQHFKISKLEVKGRETDEDSLETLDLISNRAKIVVPLEHVRSFNPAQVERLLSAALDEYRAIRDTIPNCTLKMR